jgi:cytochrome P450
MDLSNYDPFDPEVLRDPYPWYRALRDEAPCHFVPKRNLYVISRFEDVVACAKNTAVFSSTGGVGFEWEQRPMMPMYDPPQHTQLRRMVSKHFTPAMVGMLAENIKGRVDQLFAPLLENGRGELIADIAIPLSLGVIADLYGMPAKRREDLRRWSQGTVEELAGGLDAAAVARVEALRREFIGFLRETIAERRANPQKDANDVLSQILAAEDEDKLSDKEVVAFGVLLLVAGFETTVNAIANGVLALLEHPSEWQRYSADPSLLPTLVEEVVRWDCPVQSFFRNTLSDTVVAGTAIPKGVKVQILFGSANRDSRHFADADAFRIDRVPDHVGYGIGVHYCLGAPLARVELSAFFSTLRKNFLSLRSDGPVVRAHSVLFRGVKSLPIAVDRRT